MVSPWNRNTDKVKDVNMNMTKVSSSYFRGKMSDLDRQVQAGTRRKKDLAQTTHVLGDGPTTTRPASLVYHILQAPQTHPTTQWGWTDSHSC